ncbi:MAG: sodium:solute symporter family protein [Mariniblastus sp.]|nr:sodium:solute symporter family protein [Mariniblastus sp.]
MIQLSIILTYLGLLVLLGFLANRLFTGTSHDYMLASHSIGPFLLLMSLFGTTMTAFALVGSTGRAYTLGAGVYGLLASAGGIVHSLCFFLIGLRLWAIGRKNGYRTQIQFFRERLDNHFIGYLLFPILVVLVVSYLLLGVVAAGAVINGITAGTFEPYGWFEAADHGVPNSLASGVICLVVLSYVFLGGMRGTAWANAAQTVIFMVLGIVTFVTIANSIGGTDSLLENMKQISSVVPEDNLTRAKIPYSTFFSFLLIPLSVGMFPHVFQHWLTARDAGSFRWPIVLHPIFIMIVWVPCVLIGIWASTSISGIEPGTKENLLLPLLVKMHAGEFLGGLLGAGILAAIMSSLDSQFLCLGTIFTEDVVGNVASKPLSDRNKVLLARGFILLIVVVVYFLSLFPRAVFDLGLWSFTGFTGLFPVVFAAIYWRRLTAYGAISAVITTMVLWTYYFADSGFGDNKGYALLPFGPEWPVLPVVAILTASSVSVIVASLLTAAPPKETIVKFFHHHET